MNFFFGINNGLYKSELTIPKFQNSGAYSNKIRLYSIFINDNKWKIAHQDSREDKDFFYLDEGKIDSQKIFFIGKTEEIDLDSGDLEYELKNFSNFTDTTPEYRANFKIKNTTGGYSSYQSDYPFMMTKGIGNIVSSTYVLSNTDSDKNYLIFRNIYFKPIIEKFKVHIVDIKNKKKLFTTEFKTNYSNILEIDKLYINKNCYFVSEKYIGIPIFVSEKNGHISVEHTLPPSSYVLSKNKYELTKQFKKKIYDIIV